jgi:hypothetical protein
MSTPLEETVADRIARALKRHGVQRPLSAKDRDPDADSLERRNDGRIVNRVGVAFEQLQGRKSERRPEIRKSIAEAHGLEPLET